MGQPLIKTSTRGVFKRGFRYHVHYVLDGKRRWETFRTLDEARRARDARRTDITRGEFSGASRVLLRDYLLDWIERYQGTGRAGLREHTRYEYRGLLHKYTLRYFPQRLKLTELTPRMVSEFVGWLCDSRAQAKHEHRIATERAREAGKREPKPLAPDARRELADSTVKNALKPLRSAMATARREGLIRHNPCTEIVVPHRQRIQEDDDGHGRSRPA